MEITAAAAAAVANGGGCGGNVVGYGALLAGGVDVDAAELEVGGTFPAAADGDDEAVVIWTRLPAKSDIHQHTALFTMCVI